MLSIKHLAVIIYSSCSYFMTLCQVLSLCSMKLDKMIMNNNLGGI
jgi:hypothetical protein